MPFSFLWMRRRALSFFFFEEEDSGLKTSFVFCFVAWGFTVGSIETRSLCLADHKIQKRDDIENAKPCRPLLDLDER